MLAPVWKLKKSEITWLSRHRCKHGHSYLDHYNCFLKDHPKKERIGILDIETTGLEPRYSFMLTYCIKVKGSNHVYKGRISPKDITSRKYDKILIKQCINDIKKFDLIIGYYSSRFDIPYLRTRAVGYNIPFPLYKELNHKDLYFLVRSKFKFASRRLGVVCDFFDIPSKNHPMKPAIWRDALSGRKRAIDYVLRHNIEDVKATEELYNKIIEFGAPQEPSI